MAKIQEYAVLQKHADADEAHQRIKDAGRIDNVKILGAVSKNGFRYGTKSRQQASHLYEGAKIFVDHTDDAPGKPRKYADQIGRISNVRNESDGLYGTLHVNPHHQLAEQLLYDAAYSPEQVGLSHSVEASVQEADDGIQDVVSIDGVYSVDLVTAPATTSSLFESTQPKKSESTEPKESTRPETPIAQPPVNETQLREQIHADVRVNVLAALKALMDSGLSYRAWDAGLIDQILSVPSEQREAIIDQRKALVESIRTTQTTTNSPSPSSKPPSEWSESQRPTLDAKSFAELIR